MSIPIEQNTATSSEMAEPDWMTLTDDENLLWVGHESQWGFAGTYLTSAVCLIAALALPVVGLSLPDGFPITTGMISLALAVVGIVLFVLTYFRYMTTLYAVTSEQVYHRSGIIARNIDQVRMGQIQNTSCNQGIIERLLSFGTVELDTAGTAGVELNLWSINDPREVNQAITRKLNERSSETGTRSSDPADDQV